MTPDDQDLRSLPFAEFRTPPPCGGDLFAPDFFSWESSLIRHMRRYPGSYTICNYCARRANGGKDTTRKCMGHTGWYHLRAGARQTCPTCSRVIPVPMRLTSAQDLCTRHPEGELDHE